MSNPFTLVHDTLWAMLEACPQFVSLVRERNRVKFNHPVNRDPIKQEILAADLPEVIIIPDGITANLSSSSSSTMCKRQYSFLISTGDFRANDFLFKVEWAIFIALTGHRNLLCDLTYDGRKFVTNFLLISGTDGQSDQERNRGIRGFSASWQCEVEMHFSTSALKSEAS